MRLKLIVSGLGLLLAALLTTAPAQCADPGGIDIIAAAGAAHALTEAELSQLPAVKLQIEFATGHGPEQAQYEGPLLWDVLQRSGAIAAARPRTEAHQSLLVTGADGYTALLALAELSPDFEGKAVILALRMNGAALGAGHLRVVVPADRHGGRSVRDVVRITVN